MRLLYDFKRLQPGCALLQAAYNCPAVAHQFDSEDWFAAPTSDMAVYEVTPGQLDQLVEITRVNRVDREAPHAH